MGQSLVAISGGFLDLSQPANLILSSVVTVRTIEAGLPLPLVVLAAVLTGAAWGFMNAAIIVLGRINPVIVTLATNFIGLAALFLMFSIVQVPRDGAPHNFAVAAFWACLRSGGRCWCWS